MGDAQLAWEEELSRALAGDYASALLAHVRRLVNDDRQLAEDIVQETLLRAWKHAGQLPPRARRPWMFTTARHLVIDAHRARSARPPAAAPRRRAAAATPTPRRIDPAACGDARPCLEVPAFL